MSTTDTQTSLAKGIMFEFAKRSGLFHENAPKRYLWTDAFAVCNFLELDALTGDSTFRNLASRLVTQVHSVLGRHRDDDARNGWLSGLTEAKGELHPTAGGLRIGKSMPERGVHDPVDETLEWERDGQYYHYLTKWMHALLRLHLATGDLAPLHWAMELVKAAHPAFTYSPSPGTPRRMHWKMSIDLTRPQVASMGHHDPLDGLVTYCVLQAAAERAGEAVLNLKAEISDMAAICQGRSWTTEDPLGLGGLLFDAGRVAQLMAQGQLAQPDLLLQLLDDARNGLDAYAASAPVLMPADLRLAFRELGLCIGLKALPLIRSAMSGDKRITARLNKFEPHASLGRRIELFWRDPNNQQGDTWTDHLDINQVMLATALIPEGFLKID